MFGFAGGLFIGTSVAPSHAMALSRLVCRISPERTHSSFVSHAPRRPLGLLVCNVSRPLYTCCQTGLHKSKPEKNRNLILPVFRQPWNYCNVDDPEFKGTQRNT